MPSPVVLEYHSIGCERSVTRLGRTPEDEVVKAFRQIVARAKAPARHREGGRLVPMRRPACSTQGHAAESHSQVGL